MPDIAMCRGENCEMKEICYRYKAEPDKFRQSMFANSPNDGLTCEYFWEYCDSCHMKNGVHKMSCPTQKVTVFFQQMENEVHKSNNNLNK